MDLLQYGFFQHALLGSLLTAIVVGLSGRISCHDDLFYQLEVSRMLLSEGLGLGFLSWDGIRS